MLEGRGPQVDSLRLLNGSSYYAFWEPKWFEMCFVKRGRDRWLLAYSSSQLETLPSPFLQQVSDRLRVLPGSRADSIVLESTMRFRSMLYIEDETNRITLHPDGSVMHAQAVVNASRNGVPSIEASWHTDFHLIDERAKTPERPVAP